MRFATQLIAYKVQSISIPQVSDWMIKCVMVCIYYGPSKTRATRCQYIVQHS